MPETQKWTSKKNKPQSLGWLDLRACQKRKSGNSQKTQTTPVIINLDEVVALSAPFNVAEPELSEEKINIEDTPFLQLPCFHETRFFLVNIDEG